MNGTTKISDIHTYFMLEGFTNFINEAEKTKTSEKPFGYLAGYDIYNASGPLMNNSNESKKAIEKFLVALVKELKMVVAAKPVCYMSDAKEVKTMKHVGASAFVALEDSGIMLHTITNRKSKFGCIDVFSCSNFNPKSIEQFLKKSFHTDNIVSKFIQRGTKYNQLPNHKG